jgi:putative phosphoesterase
MRIGVISDTHGLLRPEALGALRGVDRILHAGDVGGPEILDRLRELAPVTTVRGNIDREPWAVALADNEVLEVDGISIYLLHNLDQLDLKPEAAGFRIVIYGHSHRPKIEEKNGVLYFNPGSAGPQRFQLPVSVGVMEIKDGNIRVRVINLEV